MWFYYTQSICESWYTETKGVVLAKRPVKSQKRSSEVLIVIPTLGDRPNLLSQTLQSIVDQKPNKPDIYLVCPADNGRINKIAKKFGAVTIPDPAKGLSAALNTGFASAKPWHKYASWMGDDDILRPGAVATTFKTLKNNPAAIAAYGYCDYIDDEGKTIFTSKAGRMAPWLMTWGPNLLPLIGILYKLSPAQKVGGYDESLKYSMDLDMWLRLRPNGRFINTKQVLGAFRWHSTSTTVANRPSSLDEAQMVKRRYLPKLMRPFSFLWEGPVRLATKLAARRVNALAAKH
jgi:glycosyltransferase involved in cell wall biosynthesis